MATQAHTTSRRSFLAAAAVAGAIVAPNVAKATPVDPIKWMANEFEAAVEAFERFNLLHGGMDNDAATDAEFDRLYDVAASRAKRIADMKATDLPSLRLKARAALWCNDEFDFMDGDTTDQKLARGIVQDLLNLPVIDGSGRVA